MVEIEKKIVEAAKRLAGVLIMAIGRSSPERTEQNYRSVLSGLDFAKSRYGYTPPA